MTKDVSYNNELNKVPLKDFTKVDMDLFWGICYKMKYQNTKTKEFTFTEIKNLINYSSNKKGSRFFNELVQMSNHLADLKFVYSAKGIYERLNLFQRFSIDESKQTLVVKVSEEFEFILNSIGSDFTIFDLDNMTKLYNPYVKELYRQLMKHKNKSTGAGTWYVTIEDFSKVLSVPKSFRMSNINTRIFNKAHEEFLGVDKKGNPAFIKGKPITPIFEEFEIERIRGKNGKKFNEISSFAIKFKEKKNAQLPNLKLVEAFEDAKAELDK